MSTPASHGPKDGLEPCSPFEPNRNISALLQLAATIEGAPAAQFDMGSPAIPGRPAFIGQPLEECYTAGCIAGWAATLWPESQIPGILGWEINQIASLLGISRETAGWLFYPEDEIFAPDDEGRDYPLIHYENIDRARAAQELRRLAFQGIVTWAEEPSPYWLLRQCDGISSSNKVVPMWLLSKSTGSAVEPNIYWLTGGDPVGPFSTESAAIRDFNASV